LGRGVWAEWGKRDVRGQKIEKNGKRGNLVPEIRKRSLKSRGNKVWKYFIRERRETVKREKCASTQRTGKN